MNADTSGRTRREEDESQFVTFLLGEEEYGIEARSVQEITGLPPVTKVPYLPESIRGVVNLRGTVIPVVDLRLKFGFPPAGYTRHTCVIVVNAGKRATGLIVDSVSEVLNLAGSSMDDSPQFGGKIRTGFMKGVGKLDGRLIIILDLEGIFTEEETARLEMAANQ